MKILLTGVAGFIAHRTCELLLEQGHEVIGVDNMNDYYDVALKDFRLSSLKDKNNFTFYAIDIEEREAMHTIFDRHDFDVVMNLAARAGVRYSIEHPEIYESTNVKGNLNLLELCKEFNVKKYVLASTSSLYAGKEMPFVETLDVSAPISPYAATKKSAEVMSYTYHHLYGIDVSVVRYFTVYGPLSRPDMAQMRFMKWIASEDKIQLNGDGEQARDFTHVDDIAAGTVAAIKEVGYEIINLGGGAKPYSINFMISTYEKLLGKTAKIKNHPFSKADMQDTWANIEKANRLLDWQPKIDFEQGLELCVKHFKDHQGFYQSIKL